ncbi:MAG TPA: hypothetical protein VMP01_20155 [Pirellulaceae bacterium]|nr:hypothetical protein [Pirellulaceae bacterium]
MARLPHNSLIGPLAVGALLAANAIVPLMWGDVYPFTSAPMFRDSPTQYAEYRVFDPQGNELPSRHYALDKDKTGDPLFLGRVYDGNPVGYGVGIAPPPVLEQEFGVIHDEATVRRHIQEQLARPENAGLEYVVVEQRVIGPIDGQAVGVTKATRWKIERLASPEGR